MHFVSFFFALTSMRLGTRLLPIMVTTSCRKVSRSTRICSTRDLLGTST